MTQQPGSTPDGSPPSSPLPPPDDGQALPRVPWSAVGPEFVSTWGYPGGKFWPEHVEILGPSGSGKTYFDATILSERVEARGSRCVFVATKPADDTILSMNWPIGDTWKEVEKNPQVIYWPRTRKLGVERKQFLHDKVLDLLSHLWVPNANTIVAFDEIATVEGLGPDIRELVTMYWREARSMGITIVGMKQRPQGIARDMHSESTWVAAFRPKDEDDAKRYAEVLGGRRRWMSVLDALDRDKHELVLSNSRTNMAVITWVDTPLRPLTPRSVSGDYGGRA